MPPMFKLSSLESKIEEALAKVDIVRLAKDGIACWHLSAKGGGWKKGTLKMRIKFRFEFVPDDQG